MSITNITDRTSRAELQKLLIITVIHSARIPVTQLSDIVSSIICTLDEEQAEQILQVLSNEKEISLAEYESVYNPSKGTKLGFNKGATKLLGRESKSNN